MRPDWPKPCKPCVNKKRSWTRMNPEKKSRHHHRCGGLNRNNRTCKGGEIGFYLKSKKARVECEVSDNYFPATTSKPKKMPIGTKIRRSRESVSGKKKLQ
ncbi:hypothetical protein MKX03_037494 [Papaver bracteatum]|nr:hypothetical protein MKX03_037494 [Papaver bracteatum]